MARLTVAICTNRYNFFLEKCIRTILPQCRGDIYGLVVVNGNKAVLQKITSFIRELCHHRQARIDIVWEPMLGLARARNRALQECKTHYIAFIDDDAYPTPNWYREILYAFDSYSAYCVGGPVSLIWKVPAPKWITPKLMSYYTYLNWGEEDINLTNRPELWLAGTNIAFEAKVLYSLGGFPVNLGRRGKSLLSGEEIFVQHIFRKKDLSIWYRANALVFHHVQLERISRQWVISRAYWQGITQELLENLINRRNNTLIRVAGLAKVALIETIRLGLLRCSPTEWITSMAYFWGKLVGYS